MGILVISHGHLTGICGDFCGCSNVLDTLRSTYASLASCYTSFKNTFACNKYIHIKFLVEKMKVESAEPTSRSSA